MWYDTSVKTQKEAIAIEEQQEKLLHQLETEGQQIAKYRKRILDMVRSSEKIDCSKMLHLCQKLNEHIASFDNINHQLIVLESDN